MQASCDVAFKYAHVREQFGQQIGTFQVDMICVNLSVCFEFLSSVTAEVNAIIAVTICLLFISLSHFGILLK